MPRHQDQGRRYPELRQAQRASGTAGAQSGAADTRGRQGEIRGPTACKGLSDSGRTRMRHGTGLRGWSTSAARPGGLGFQRTGRAGRGVGHDSWSQRQQPRKGGVTRRSYEVAPVWSRLEGK
jgi:hypothetical protein